MNVTCIDETYVARQCPRAIGQAGLLLSVHEVPLERALLICHRYLVRSTRKR